MVEKRRIKSERRFWLVHEYRYKFMNRAEREIEYKAKALVIDALTLYEERGCIAMMKFLINEIPKKRLLTVVNNMTIFEATNMLYHLAQAYFYGWIFREEVYPYEGIENIIKRGIENIVIETCRSLDNSWKRVKKDKK